ncbi:hypothetical protein Barb6_01065 [Bacteroidales bacterium Barb6]|nr:hypothetical protein Barb6_01065 [Bacteroidales bacterium Barb6]
MYKKDNGISCIGMIVAAACNSIMVALVICAFKDIALVF